MDNQDIGIFSTGTTSFSDKILTLFTNQDYQEDRTIYYLSDFSNVHTGLPFLRTLSL